MLTLAPPRLVPEPVPTPESEPQHVMIRVDARKKRWRVTMSGLGVQYECLIESTTNRGRELEWDVILDEVRGLPCVLDLESKDEVPRFLLRKILGFAKTGIVAHKEPVTEGQYVIKGIDPSGAGFGVPA